MEREEAGRPTPLLKTEGECRLESLLTDVALFLRSIWLRREKGPQPEQLPESVKTPQT